MKQGKIPLLPVFAKKCKCIQKFRITRTLDRMVTKDLHHKFFIFFPTLINNYTYPAFHIIKTGFVFFSYRDIYIILCRKRLFFCMESANDICSIQKILVSFISRCDFKSSKCLYHIIPVHK